MQAVPVNVRPYMTTKFSGKWSKYHRQSIKYLIPASVIQTTKFIVKDGITYDIYGFASGRIIDVCRIADTNPTFDAFTSTYQKYLIDLYAAFETPISVICYNPSIDLYTNVVHYPDPLPNSDDRQSYITRTWVRASETRNYLLEDPILDYFEMIKTRTRGTKRATPDDPEPEECVQRRRISTTTHTQHRRPTPKKSGNVVFKLGIDFETQCVSKLIEYNPGDFVKISDSIDSHLAINATRTLEAMRLGIPIIYQGALHDRRRKIMGCPDLIVRADYIAKLSPNTPLSGMSIPERGDAGSHRYVIIDIKFHKLRLMADGTHIRNEGSIRAFKGQIYVYNTILAKYQGWNPGVAFVLGRGWEQGGLKSLNPFDCLGRISFDETDTEIVRLTEEAITWRRKCNRGVAQRPAPNMKNHADTEFRAEKEAVAVEMGDLTQLCYVGPRSREIAIRHGITRIDDRRLTSEILGLKGRAAEDVDALLRGRYQRNRIIVSPGAKRALPKHSIEVYMDFETFFDFESDTTIPYFLGIGVLSQARGRTTWSYQPFMLKSLKTLESHITAIHAFLQQLMTSNRLSILPCYEWTGVEHQILGTMLAKYSLNLNVEFYDVHKICRENRVIIRGMTNYGLKTVGRCLKETRLTEIDWEYKDNCLFSAMEHYCGGKKWDPAGLIAYNQTDCLMVKEVVRTIREHR